MTATIALGWWIVPLAITIATLACRWWIHRDDGQASGYGAIGASLGRALSGLAALVVILLAWLIFAVLT